MILFGIDLISALLTLVTVAVAVFVVVSADMIRLEYLCSF